MLTYDLTQGDGPLYRRLYDAIRRDAISGNFDPCEKLPSKRTLARNLGVSAITVENAYDQLVSEGFVYTLPKKGYFIAPSIPQKRRVAQVLDLEINATPNRAERGSDAASILFDFSSNRADPELFPFSAWAKMIRAAMTTREKKLLEPSPGVGVLELRRAIANYLASFRGLSVDPNQIVVGSGAEYLYGLVVQLLGRDKIFCVETPGYKKPRQIYEAQGVECRLARIDDKGARVDELKRVRADVAHINPTHHFPTGVTATLSRRHELLAWANERDERYVLEDDYDSEFRFNGRPIVPMFGLDPDKVVYMNTFSKSLAPTIRISYMALPVALANRFYEKLGFYSCTVSTFDQYALAEFLRQGYFERHINRMRLHYSRKRTRVLEIIRRALPPETCRIIENDSGLHFILQLQTRYADAELQARLLEKGIRLAAVSEFDEKEAEEYRGMFLLNYSGIDLNGLENAVAILKDAM